jgi:HPt (histidine-containing phosphotransfer) domain-containing protein
MPMTLPTDEIILELLPEFIEDWLRQLESDFHPILERKNELELYRLGHTLKGSCLQFGLEEPAQLGIKLMALSKEHKWDEAQALYEPIHTMFVEARAVLKAKLGQ